MSGITHFEDKMDTLSKNDIEKYTFTQDIDKNTKMLVERLNYDEVIDDFDDQFNCPHKSEKVNWDVISKLLLNEKKLHSVELNYLGYYYQHIKKNYELVKKHYLMAIEKGNSNAMNNLGFYYENIENNYGEAKKYYEMAIEKGNGIAMNNLGFYYFKIEKKYDEAKKYYLMAIEKGRGIAMNNLCFYYENIEKKYGEAKKYYLMAIEKGKDIAMNNLGFYYVIIEKKYDEAKKYYLMAIKKGNMDAMNNLGLYYKNIEKNYDEAKKYYLMAIEKGNDVSRQNLIFYYDSIEPIIVSKEGIKKYKFANDIDKNTKMLLKRLQYDENIDSFDNNITKSNIDWAVIKTLLLAEKELTGIKANYLGFYYQCIENNYNEAKKYSEIAIEKGNSNAMNDLGLYYENIEENYDEAKKYYLMAVEKGNIAALNNLGCYYENIEENYDEAKKYYLMAIKKDNADAMNNLGCYYDNIDKNYGEAKKYYLMAVEKGHSNAMFNLGYYYDNIEKNYDEAKKYYLMAIEKGDSDAMNYLGLYYKNIEENYDEAKKYYLMAIEKGNDVARKNLISYYDLIEPICVTKDDIEKYKFTDDIDKNTKMLLERLKYDVIIDIFDKNIKDKKIDWIVIKTLLLAEKERTGTKDNYLGYYYNFIEKNHNLLSTYYYNAINKRNIMAMFNLGYYHHTVRNEYYEAKKYYRMAGLGQKNNLVVNYLYDYYKSIEPVNVTKEYIMNYEFADNIDKNTKMLFEYIENDMYVKKFDDLRRKNIDWEILLAYLLSKSHHNAAELYYLGYCYDHSLAYMFDTLGFGGNCMKYYHMAADKNHTGAMSVLGIRYYDEDEEEYEKSKQYHLMAIERGSDSSMEFLGNHYRRLGNYHLMKKYYIMAFEYGNEMTLGYLLEYFERYNVNEKIFLPTEDIIYNTKKLLETIKGSSHRYTSELISCEFDNEVIKVLFNKLNPPHEARRISNMIFYYAFIDKNEDELKKYSEMALENSYDDALYVLGKYNLENENYAEMKKYYEKAIDLGNSDAMNDLGRYYKNIEQEYEEMDEYFTMAIEKGNSNAMNNMGHYYQYIDVKYDEMKKYYEMAIKKGNTGAMNNLGYYYQHIEKKYEYMIQYYADAIKYKNKDAYDNLIAFLIDAEVDAAEKDKIIKFINKSEKISMSVKLNITSDALRAIIKQNNV